MTKLTKAQWRVLRFIAEWENRNNGYGACVGRNIDGSNRNDESVAFRLSRRGMLDWQNFEYTHDYIFSTTDAGREALSTSRV